MKPSKTKKENEVVMAVGRMPQKENHAVIQDRQDRRLKHLFCDSFRYLSSQIGFVPNLNIFIVRLVAHFEGTKGGFI